MADLDKFMEILEYELIHRYRLCEESVPPDSILLAVANAVAEARKKATESHNG